METSPNTPNASDLQNHKPWYRRAYGRVLIVFFILGGLASVWFRNDVIERAAVSDGVTLDSIKKDFTPASEKDLGETKKNALVSVNVDSATAPSFGPKNAPLTIVGFFDFECPFCKKEAMAIRSWAKNYPTQVRFVFRNYPLSDVHPDALRAAEAAMCAHAQGKFWEYYDQLYVEDQDLSANGLDASAVAVHLDMEKFRTCVSNRSYRLAIQDDIQAGRDAAVDGTPTFFVQSAQGGKRLSGAVPPVVWDEIIYRLLGANR